MHLTVPNTTVPTRPPQPEQDALDGYLDAYLAQPVKPHRDRLVDILRVINGTQTGHELLDYFRDRASLNNVPTVNLLAPGAEVPDSSAAHDVWLKEEALTGHAQEIGVSPETEYAPSVFQSLSITRAAVLVRNYIDGSHKDLAAMQARFLAELNASGDPLSARADRAATIEVLRLDAQRTQAMSKLSPGGDSHTAPTDPRPDGETPDNSSLSQLPATAAVSSVTTLVASDGTRNDDEAAAAIKRTKSARQRMTQWAGRPLRAIGGLLARRRLTWARSGKSTGVPEASVYKSDGLKPRTSSTSSSTNRTDAQTADRASLAHAATANGGSRVQTPTASTTNLAEPQGAGTPSLVETHAAGKASLAQAPAASTSSPAEV
ncbi:MAG TPA: hypothetical protein VL522_17385 [Bordetella sp.]|nr:hypothetical protein [Bordetella sp.]